MKPNQGSAPPPLERWRRCAPAAWPECGTHGAPALERRCDVARPDPNAGEVEGWAGVFAHADRALAKQCAPAALPHVRAVAIWRVALRVVTELGKRRAAAELEARRALERLATLNHDHEAWALLALDAGKAAAAEGDGLDDRRVHGRIDPEVEP